MKKIFLLLGLSFFASQPAWAVDHSLDGLKLRIVGSWTSIACELLPSPNQADPTLAPTPTYLTRDFIYHANSGFDAAFTVYADAACSVPLATYEFMGDIVSHGANPAAKGAWSQDYVLNKELTLTVKAQPMADQLNQLPSVHAERGHSKSVNAATFWVSLAFCFVLLREAITSLITISYMSERIRRTCYLWGVNTWMVRGFIIPKIVLRLGCNSH